MRNTVSLLALIALAACSKKDAVPTGLGSGGVQPVVGAYCTSSQVSSAVAQGADWWVTIYWNQTTYRNVAGTDGIVRQQEVRSCRSGTCVLTNGVSTMSASSAIQYCAGQLIP